MQDHLKERLTGAAILVAVVVLLVPELFHGRTPADAGLAASASGPPVRSVTIDLGDVAGGRPLTENAPAAAPLAAPAAAAAPALTAPSTVTAQAPTAPPAKVAAAVPTAPAAKPAATAHAAAAAPATTNSAQNARGAVQSGWTVQVGSFARRDFAERMVKDASAKGFTVEVAGPDDRGLYRVRSPPRADRAAALALKQKMQASGYKPIVNKAP